MRCSLIVSRTVIFALFILLATLSLLAQATGGASPVPNVSLPGQQNPFLGSAPEGKATGDVLQIDFKDAIDRGLRNNLGLLLASDQTQMARGERWKELSELLPNVRVPPRLGSTSLYPCSPLQVVTRALFRAWYLPLTTSTRALLLASRFSISGISSEHVL